MIEFLVRRALISAVTLLLITVIVFTGVRMIPGDPARVLAGTDADASGLEEIREKYGLKDPIPVQYLRWLALAVRGDLGESIRTRTSSNSYRRPHTRQDECAIEPRLDTEAKQVGSSVHMGKRPVELA